ncbi:MAG: hypothetical protein EXX96DRAFT_616548 [Benjaminiella poitrasii]|nr:MAG: hypothetical protein EXX96DRAFT_616548 [Benjaminiella poitrasii]
MDRQYNYLHHSFDGNRCKNHVKENDRRLSHRRETTSSNSHYHLKGRDHLFVEQSHYSQINTTAKQANYIQGKVDLNSTQGFVSQFDDQMEEIKLSYPSQVITAQSNINPVVVNEKEEEDERIMQADWTNDSDDDNIATVAKQIDADSTTIETKLETGILENTSKPLKKNEILPNPWVMYTTDKGQRYYYDKITRESVWELPESVKRRMQEQSKHIKETDREKGKDVKPNIDKEPHRYEVTSRNIKKNNRATEHQSSKTKSQNDKNKQDKPTTQYKEIEKNDYSSVRSRTETSYPRRTHSRSRTRRPSSPYRYPFHYNHYEYRAFPSHHLSPLTSLPPPISSSRYYYHRLGSSWYDDSSSRYPPSRYCPERFRFLSPPDRYPRYNRGDYESYDYYRSYR